MDREQSDSEDSEDDGKICGATADEYFLDDEVGKKRDCPLEDSISNNKTKKRQRVDAFVIDLSDVPPQSPIPKSSGCVKEGASKYTGVSFDKRMNKWHAQIMIAGKSRNIGYYENEEEAAVDYARALFKYKGQGALDKARERRALDKEREQNGEICGVTTAVKGLCDRHSTHGNKYGLDNEVGKKRALTSGGSIGGNKTKKCKKVDAFVLDLTGVPPQSPIPKSGGHIKEGASKYKGVHFNKQKNKWQAKLGIEGKNRHIGYYDNEEEAATDYARAVFKYKNQAALGKAREDSFIIDLSDVPPQPPIPKSSGTIKEGASKYTGVHFNKQANKWRVQIDIKGKYRTIGHYENEDEAATDYARAVFKYKNQAALDYAAQRSRGTRQSKETKSIRRSNGAEFNF
ncbi:putative AP2/ERF family transcription factor family protein [Skeletonema marinoi]|uniref:AP2/ERF family transcription factor family protein n=1 Tax=Skeletonema marinoi TaxID=267567 RepID=A0AAD8Y6D6_9STRA|nr:putative AP2/ERF family transcription factor family protein [Skeletonema marinoi]